MKNTRGSEWHKWDLHLHTASSYDSHYKGKDADMDLSIREYILRFWPDYIIHRKYALCQ